MHLFLERDIGALLMRVWLFQATPASGEITPANLLVAGTAIAVVVAGMVSAIVLAVVNNWLAKDRAQRDAASIEVKNYSRLIDGVVVLGEAVKESNAAQVKEREEQRAMLENKTEASAGRDSVKKVINEHMDEQVKLLREDFTKLQTTWNDTAARFEQGVTAAELIEALKPIKQQLDNISQRVTVPPPVISAPIPSPNGDSAPVPETPSA